MRSSIRVAFGAGLACISFCGTAHAQRPWRITLGYDSSRLTSAYPYLLSVSRQYSYSNGWTTTSEEGALLVGVSYDFFRDTKHGIHGFVYGDVGGWFFTHLYNAVGVGARKEIADISGGNVYVGAGLGLYTVYLGHGTSLGGKAFLGLQSRGALFMELGLPLIANNDFKNGGTLNFGFRL